MVRVIDVPDSYRFKRETFDLRHYAEHLKGLFDYCASPGKEIKMSWDIAEQTALYLKETN